MLISPHLPIYYSINILAVNHFFTFFISIYTSCLFFLLYLLIRFFKLRIPYDSISAMFIKSIISTFLFLRFCSVYFFATSLVIGAKEIILSIRPRISLEKELSNSGLPCEKPTFCFAFIWYEWCW